METTENELISRSQAGDAAAFEVLVRRHEQKIYNLILGMTANATETADLFQETFLSAWKNIKKFKGGSSFSTWVYRIAVNAVLMKWRKKKPPVVSIDADLKTLEEDVPRDIPDDWSKSPLATLENEELNRKLHAAIGALPEKYRTPLILSDLQGLPNEETAKILGISLGSVKTRLHRARLYLRRELSGYFKDKP